MKFHALSLSTLLTLSIGCADDGTTDDDVGDTGSTESTGESSSSETESGSTDDSTSSTDSGETSESTDATESTESTTDTDDTTGETESTSDSTESTTESTESETTDTGDGTTDTGEEIDCPGVFPDFDKSCSGDNDCAVVIHTTDCCGNSVAWGINENEVDAFDAAEEICDGQYPPCGCPAGPTIAEDGNQVLDPDSLSVECVMGSCMSYVP
jgi:hypothetical protein